MLSLVDVKKDYYVGTQTINALKGITLDFEDTGLVAILGQSGCGKTTLMNIIGGLDKYTSGDVIINGQSTKNYQEKDWNTYRNNSIGFVFQSYNLIPHMNVLGNVELALTLSGIDAKERKERALAMLDKVGLLDQATKKPNQISGGQCQRVAIARALINNPSIILADEPTGAIDSETSIQIMELLKEISKECLIIMVTHNSDLANQYSDRIINMKDGLILDEKNCEKEEILEDTQDNIEDTIEIQNEEVIEPEEQEPIQLDEEKEEVVQEAPVIQQKKKRASMSFFTAFKLSLANLFNKKGRTILTVIAGSIGIICISLILSMNSGFSTYINNYESSSLSKYPIKAYSQTSSLMDMINDAMHEDDIDVSKIDLNTVIDIFKEDESLRIKYTDEQRIYLEKVLLSIIENGMENSGIKLDTDISKFVEELDANFDPSWGTIRKDYSLRLNIYTEKDNKYSQINPLYETMMASLGSMIPTAITDETKNQIKTMMDSLKTWSMMVDDKDVLNSQYDVLAGHFPDYTTEDGMKEIVIVVDEYNQIDDDILMFLDKISIQDFMVSFITGSSDNIQQEYDFNEFLGKEFTLMINSDYYTYNTSTKRYDYSNSKETIDTYGIKIKIAGIVRLKEGLSAGSIGGTMGYTQALAEYIINKINNSQIVKDQQESYQKYEAAQTAMQEAIVQASELGYNFSDMSKMTQEQIADMLSQLQAEDPQIAMAITKGMMTKIKNVITGEYISESDYEQVLEDLSVRSLNKPSSLYIYPTSIENKDKVINLINNFNNKIAADEALSSSSVDYTVSYTDDLSQITESMQGMINTITYILIAVAILAVVVAMLLVAIILYISVQDRTKEIGILRSLGASKGNVSSVFIAETFIIGLISGIIGVVVGLICIFPGNAIIVKVLGINNLLQPTWWQCLLLIAVSFATTVISGLIPACLAAKKDPVLALRTE